MNKKNKEKFIRFHGKKWKQTETKYLIPVPIDLLQLQDFVHQMLEQENLIHPLHRPHLSSTKKRESGLICE